MSFLSKPISAVRGEWEVLIGVARSGSVREVVRWCLPALVLGALVRVVLTIHFPYGYFQGDSADFLVTAERLMKHHRWMIHGKKAFLTPILFTIPFLLHVPALIVIPAAQHLAGLAATVMAGALVRFWFRLWRVFIVPVTVIYTLNPALLWYEHALLAECHYLFCTTGLALAGTLLVRRATMRRFVWLIVALFFTAGSRPEGKLFVLFGLGVTALVYWGNWRVWAWRMGVLLACCAGIWMCSRSTQAGLLLYATVLPLAPDVSKVAPGIEPFIAPLRNAGIAQGATVRTKLNSIEKRANNAIRAYLKSIGQGRDQVRVNGLAQKLAVEAVQQKPGVLPIIATNKFLMTFKPNPDGAYIGTSGGYTAEWVIGKQTGALVGRKNMKPILQGLTGRDLKDNEEVAAFLREKYEPYAPEARPFQHDWDWFGLLQGTWNRITIGCQWNAHWEGQRRIPGWPLFWLVAAAGMAASLISRDGMWRFHVPWVGSLMAVWFIVMLTGIVLARYRFVFEPFGIFYVFLLLDFLWSGVAGLANVRRNPRTVNL